MDAALMDGRSVLDGGDPRGGGAVAAVIATRSPIACARAVYASSVHNLLAGSGADSPGRYCHSTLSLAAIDCLSLGIYTTLLVI
jgi:isoaspartyl peptidase/L-asparaginase-like protein (Ntn-hydrolase superfamily)